MNKNLEEKGVRCVKSFEDYKDEFSLLTDMFRCSSLQIRKEELKEGEQRMNLEILETRMAIAFLIIGILFLFFVTCMQIALKIFNEIKIVFLCVVKKNKKQQSCFYALKEHEKRELVSWLDIGKNLIVVFTVSAVLLIIIFY